ncbi:MAG TPA: hypothetical protein VMH87_11090 [Pseudomonadales bacterium]|nr:hypothetical protein [Pseudomonadales bacterium]
MKRYVPLAVWIVVVSAIIYIPLKIIGYGFLPMDDALRHAAKTVSGKSWQQILVMRDDFPIDPSPGWQKILEWVHDINHGDAESLVIFSVIALMLLVMSCGVPWFRRPEAWLAALMIASVFIPACTTRFARGRPYILTDAVVITILILWTRWGAKRQPSPLYVTPLLVAASAWIHGSWYMLVLPGVAILFAGMWHEAILYVVCWLLGSVLGCALTGHPIVFLLQSVRHMFGVFGNFTVGRQLEPELHPSDGAVPAVLAVAALLLWRKASLGWDSRKLLNPVFMMMALGWLLGLKMQRFWWDYGTPAFIIWVAMELQEHLEKGIIFDSIQRLFLALAIAAGAYLGFTSDRDGRWTENLTTAGFISESDPKLAGWLPEQGGIIYNSDMDVFFETFYQNPTADWKYVLGFESGWMLPDDLKIIREYQWTFGNAQVLEQWVPKMRPQDRMIIHATGSGRPNIPELEWNYAATEIWIGRLPRAGVNSATTPPEK